MSDVLVDIRDVAKTYIPAPLWLRLLIRSSSRQPIHALRGVSLQVKAGEICAVVGPNGAGKSTLFRVLTGLTTPTRGRALVCGLDATHESARVRRLIGFMPADDRSLYLRNSVVENLRFHGRLQGMSGRTLEDRITEILELVDLNYARDRVGFALSSGMRARLQLARALLHRPRVLILDEPTASVDPVAAYGLVQLLKQVVTEEQVAVLISSHRLEEVDELHDNVLMLNEGQAVYWGDLDVARQRWEGSNVEIQYATVDQARQAADRLAAFPNLEVLSTDEALVTLQTKRPTGEILAELNGQVEGIISFRQSKMSLLQLFRTILNQRDMT